MHSVKTHLKAQTVDTLKGSSDANFPQVDMIL